jgi:hypothetical protein
MVSRTAANSSSAADAANGTATSVSKNPGILIQLTPESRALTILGAKKTRAVIETARAPIDRFNFSQTT